MKVSTLKDLKALIKMCRSTGVNRIEVDGVKLELGDVPDSLNRNAAPITTSDKIETEPSYTEEEIMTWSSTPNA